MMFGYRLSYFILRPWVAIREVWHTLHSFWQRGRRGWAVCDTWQADTYMAEVISGLCAHIAEHGMGIPWPFFEQENGGKVYSAYLKELASAFGDYAHFMSDANLYGEDIGNVQYNQLIERMRPLFDYFSTISD